MNLGDFNSRDDLCPPGIRKVYFRKDYGAILKAKAGWFATNDIRWSLVGTIENSGLVQPTVGPFRSAKEAVQVYVQRKDKANGKPEAGK